MRLSAAACALAAVLLALASARADAGGGDELRLAIVLTRHGVRAPISSNEEMASLASRPWPEWEVPTAIQTPRGNLLVAYMGDYYRARFAGAGLLSGDPARDGPLVFVRADNDQRTMETGRILGKALVQAGDPDVHPLPQGTADPLFRTVGAHVGHPDPALAVAAVLGRLGGDPGNIERAYAPQFAELKGILFGPGGAPAGSPFGAPSVVKPGKGDYLMTVSGPLQAAEHATDSFILQYTDGKPAAEVGWGQVDGRVITDLLSLHEFYFDLVCRTRYIAQVEGSNLASHIIDTLEQAALGQPVPGALGPAGERVVVLAGHDGNIANIGGLLGLDWWVPGTQLNPMLPGGALVFELWRRGGSQDSFFVRLSYVTQTLDQMRDASPLSLEHPPALAPIFIPGCSGPGPGFDAPLASFVRQARKVIDPAFIAPEP
jgi:4-phytase / acid phosphatase